MWLRAAKIVIKINIPFISTYAYKNFVLHQIAVYVRRKYDKSTIVVCMLEWTFSLS